MIFISAGHHAARPGASFDGFNEYDEAQLWCAQLRELMQESCLAVPTGVLKEKVAFINNRDPSNSIAVEIHFNAAKNEAGEHIGKGCETLYFPKSVKGKQLATALNTTLAAFFEPDRGIKEGWYAMNPKNGPDFFLAKTHCPAVILEPDFIHRKEQIQARRESCCQELALSLLNIHEVLHP